MDGVVRKAQATSSVERSSRRLAAPAVQWRAADVRPACKRLHSRRDGSGGAARAAIFALGQLGVARVIVRARKEKRALADVLQGSGAELSFEPLVAPPSEAADLCAIVQATTAGIDGSSVPGSVVADAVAWATVPAGCVVYDVVYAPPQTPLLARASARGLAGDSGLGMLVGQGALAFELWLGVKPPVDVMRAALG